MKTHETQNEYKPFDRLEVELDCLSVNPTVMGRTQPYAPKVARGKAKLEILAEDLEKFTNQVEEKIPEYEGFCKLLGETEAVQKFCRDEKRDLKLFRKVSVLRNLGPSPDNAIAAHMQGQDQMAGFANMIKEILEANAKSDAAKQKTTDDLVKAVAKFVDKKVSEEKK